MLAPVTHILPLTTVVRTRMLPAPGRVVVRVGQKVTATEVIAETALPRQHLLINVSHALGVRPDQVNKIIQCKKGDRLAKGTVIAETGGFIPRTVRAPQEGRVVVVGDGQVMLEVGQVHIELKAGIPGEIAQVIPDRGVIIHGSGALIQGRWGNGRLDFGLLLSLAEAPDAVLEAGMVDIGMRGSVILGGYVAERKVLDNAAELPVRGLVLSSLAPELVPAAVQMRYPIIVLEGLGRYPFNAAAHRLLTTNAKREVAVNAEVPDRYSGARPEVMIPLPANQPPPIPPEAEIFAEGQQVRINRAPWFGAVGSVASILPGMTALPNGIKAKSAAVQLQSGEQVTVPLANLEVLA
jgi:hypothetical protein